MPLLEGACENPECDLRMAPQEHFYHHWDSPMRACDCCGGPTRKLVSTFGIIWTGPIGQRYRDKAAEGFHAPDGQVAWTRKTPDGKPRQVRLETWQDVGRYAKAEGCYDPREIPKTVEIGADGKSCSSRGFAGQET